MHPIAFGRIGAVLPALLERTSHGSAREAVSAWYDARAAPPGR